MWSCWEHPSADRWNSSEPKCRTLPRGRQTKNCKRCHFMTHSASVVFFLLISSHCSSKVLSGRKIPKSSFGIWASKSSIANENFQWGVKLFYLNWQWFLLACLTKAWDEFTWKSHSSKKVILATFNDPALTIFQTLIFKLKFCHSGKLQNPHFWPKPQPSNYWAAHTKRAGFASYNQHLSSANRQLQIPVTYLLARQRHIG